MLWSQAIISGWAQDGVWSVVIDVVRCQLDADKGVPAGLALLKSCTRCRHPHTRAHHRPGQTARQNAS